MVKVTGLICKCNNIHNTSRSASGYSCKCSIDTMKTVRGKPVRTSKKVGTFKVAGLEYKK